MSDVSVDIIKNRNGEAPDLPSGANLSGVSTAATLQVTNLNPTHINASGVTTATTFSGSLKSTGTPTLGLGVTINSSGINISGVATAGIVSATTLYGDGSNLTGVAMSIAPISYNPDVNDSSVTAGTGIGITFTERVKAGSGNVTLRIAGAAGTVVENFGVGSSVTINNNQITIDPTSDLTAGETYHISYPSGAFTNTGGDVSYVGTAYTFGVKPEFRTLFAWGNNNYGQLGLNSETRYSSPVQIPGINWNQVVEGYYHLPSSVAATKTDGTLWVWGRNNYGQLSQNNNISYSSPVQIPGTTWNKAFTTKSAIKTDGTLWVWGSNGDAELGLNDKTQRSSPTQIPGTTWKEGYIQGSVGGGVKTDGTLWMWGYGGTGQLGLNQGGPSAFKSSPTQVPGTTWSTLHISPYVVTASKTDGTLWVWGYANYGQLANNGPGNVNYSSPIQIPGTTWSTGEDQLSGGQRDTVAIKTDGTLWTWGANQFGQGGQNTSTDSSSPVQIPGTTWSKVAMGSYTTYALKTDGTLWSWGYGNMGALGDNTITHISSPVQIPGTTWGDMGSSSYSGFGIKVE